ncbi:hypothetical protein LCGC14_1010870 [marine sediment metagenome]|uniref:Uncharacterized protein n=1 Tax=marine sediment metagenome TaxID=412755 RepID=A0A0F9N4U2_9ZZZZ
MNIKKHFALAEGLLKMANEQVEAKDYRGARASLAKAYSHTRELLDHVQKLLTLKAHVEHSAEDTTG